MQRDLIHAACVRKRELMGRIACCDKKGLKKGAWTHEEEEKLIQYINNSAHSNWPSLPKLAGLVRCGKSFRLRWTNYLRPNIKRGPFSQEEEELAIQLHGILGNSLSRWAAIALELPGRTENEIKNLWNTHLKKRLFSMGTDPHTHEPSLAPMALVQEPPASSSASSKLTLARLSKESHFVISSSVGRSESDYFLRIWNSETGEAFRKLKEVDKTAC